MARTVTEEAMPSGPKCSLHVGLSLLTLFPGRVGGTETAVRELLEQFAAGNGPAQVTVLANRHVAKAYAGFRRGPVELRHVRSYRAGDSMATRALAMATARLAPGPVAWDLPRNLDLLHYAVTVPIPRFDGPTVTTIFDVQHLDRPEFFSRAERLHRRWAYEGAARRATLVVTSSEYSKRRLIEAAGVPGDRIEVVPLGIDHSRFQPCPQAGDEALLRELHLPPRFLLYPANLWPHKNHERLVDALVASQIPDLALLLTGQTYGRLEGLLRRAQSAGVGDRVRHLGYVPHDAMPALYRATLAMVFPSLYEGFGSPPLEAMASGCPVAASPRGSLGEICGDAAVGLDPDSVDDIARAIRLVASDAALRASLRSKGLRWARHFCWPRVASRHRQIYERATATYRRSPPL